MGSVILALTFTVIGFISLSTPWVGVVAAYWVAVLNPQAIWWWTFEGFRPALFVTLPVLAGFVAEAARGRLTFDAVKNVRTAGLLVLLVCCGLSAIWGPYALHGDEWRIRSAEYIFEVQAKIIMLYLIGCLCASSERALKAMGWMVAACSAYLVYWANDRYLQLGWVRRLEGPRDLFGAGNYLDENNFATFFVVTLPFVWYMSFTLANRWIRYAMWLIVPFGWHALFLTGSRGGLLGMLVVLAFTTLRRGQRIYGVLLAIAFGLAFHFQAGDSMKERAATIDNYEEDASATGRLEAWDVAVSMMSAYPISGVGPGGFIRAWPSFSDLAPAQAHNTYFQIGAEYGPVAAIALLFAMISSLIALFRVRRRLMPRRFEPEVKVIYAVCEATLTGLIGLIVCSIFLSLQLFELLYFLLFMSSASVACAYRVLSRSDTRSLGGSQFADSSAVGEPVGRPSANADRSA